MIGEVLFDCFPDGNEILGGAPFNVAWNLQGLGAAPLFVSAIGPDDKGQGIIEALGRWGMAVTGLQKVDRATGRVDVVISDGEPTYDIVSDQAYDHLSFTQFFEHRPETIPLVYHGALAFRGEGNRAFLAQLLDSVPAPRFVDLNIRQPWFDRNWLSLLVQDATWVKVNEHELGWLAETPIDPKDEGSVIAATDEFKRICSSAPTQTLVVTCGSYGAYWISPEGCWFEHATPASADSFVDTVGAGDAFSAAAIKGILSGDSPRDILAKAVAFAAKACRIQGATTMERLHYRAADLPTFSTELNNNSNEA